VPVGPSTGLDVSDEEADDEADATTGAECGCTGVAGAVGREPRWGCRPCSP
jgi:hypothetical protein